MTDSPAWRWPDTVITNVVDGDTVDALVRRDLGFGGWATIPIRLRLNRINAAPAHTVEGKAATDYLASLLPPTAPLLVDTYRTYKYGGGTQPEWMAEISLPDGRSVSDVMVSGGHAVYWDGRGPRPGG